MFFKIGVNFSVKFGKILTILLTIPLLLCSCSTNNVQKRESIAVSKAVYAINDSIEAGRFDLAKKYSTESTRIVAPPPAKERIKVNKFEVKEKQSVVKNFNGEDVVPPFISRSYVVLPSGYDETRIVVVGSEQYNKLLDENKDLRKQISDEINTFSDYKRNNDKLLRDKEEELQKLRSKPGFFKTIWNFATGFLKWGMLGIIIVGVGFVLLAFLVPGLAPFIWAIFRTIGSIFGGILRLLSRAMYWIIERFSKK